MLKSMDTLVALCKGRGIIYPGSEIYGGLANTWDYGPLGNEIKNNVKNAWRKKVIQEQSKDFDGKFSDAKIMREYLQGIARNTYYKYKRELKEA